jgi:hypothetical protein
MQAHLGADTMPETYADKFFENLYKSEFDRKDKSDGLDSFLLASLSILGTIGLYYIQILPLEYTWWMVIVYWVLTILYLLLIGQATFCTAFSIWPRPIGYLGEPFILRNYHDQVKAHFVYYDENDPATHELIDRQMLKMARTQHIEAAGMTRLALQTKNAWQTRARRALSLAIILLLVNAIPTFFIQRERNEFQQVKILEWPNTAPIKGTP